MSDYIRREDAIEFIENLVSSMSVCVSKDECSGMNSMKFRAIGAIHDVPAADVRENVRGEWVPKGRWYCCSECGHDMIFTGTFDDEKRYCSWCGADMRGVNDE